MKNAHPCLRPLNIDRKVFTEWMQVSDLPLSKTVVKELSEKVGKRSTIIANTQLQASSDLIFGVLGMNQVMQLCDLRFRARPTCWATMRVLECRSLRVQEKDLHVTLLNGGR